MTKVLLLVADGMGDWPLDELEGKTPLEAARTPGLDFLALHSRVGLCRTIPDNLPPGSDIANMALMGYDPLKYHTGRGPIEAVAMGLEPGEKDLVWRCNLVSLTGLEYNGKMLDYAAGHITTAEAKPLIEMLRDRLDSREFGFHPGVQYRHILIQKQGLSTPAAGIDISPPHDILDQLINKDLDAYQSYPPLWAIVSKAAQILNHEENWTKARFIWPWGQGGPLRLPSFKDRFKLEGAVVSAVDLVKGLGRAAGMKAVDVPGANGLLDTNYQGKLQAAKAFLETGDFVLVHLEAPDECGHMGNIADKIEAIARFDRHIVSPLLEHLKGEDFIMIACCDHLTPIKLRTHARDPVPFLVYSSAAQVSGTREFSEKKAAATGLFLENGYDLLPFALGRQSS